LALRICRLCVPFEYFHWQRRGGGFFPCHLATGSFILQNQNILPHTDCFTALVICFDIKYSLYSAIGACSKTRLVLQKLLQFFALRAAKLRFLQVALSKLKF
jgi:hypothetical protein